MRVADFEALEPEREGKNGKRIVSFLLVIAVCLATGILLGWLTGGTTAPTAEPKQAPLRLVFLGYESLAPPAALRAIWILTLDGNGGAEFLGVSPALVVTTELGQPAVLRDFLSDPSAAPARALQIGIFPQPFLVVEFDSQGFAMMVNRTGGVPIDGAYLGGADLSAQLSQGDPDPLAALRFQLRVVRGLFAADPCPSDSSLAGLNPEHYASSLAPDLLVAECRKRGPYLKGSVSFRIMENVTPWQLPDGSIGLLEAEE
jgi:hypothetical protein